MKLMIINPDWGVTGERMRQELKQLSAFVSPDTTLDMECLQRTRVYLDSPADAVWAGPEIVEMAVRAEKNGYDAVVLYCFSDPALEACRQAVSIPVVGAGQTACLMIPQAGYQGCVLTADAGRIPEKLADISRTGLDAGRILGFEGVSVEGLDVVRDRELVLERLAEAGRRILCRTPGQVLVLGCLIFLGMASELEERLQVPVLDAAALSVGMAELLVRQNIHSSRRAYPAWRRNSDN